MTRALWRIVYELVARRLPDRHWPLLGPLAGRVRARCVAGFVAQCGANLRIARNVTLPSSSRLGRDVTINEDCRLCGTIGDFTLIGPQCYMISRNHRFEKADAPIARQGYELDDPARIGRDVWIGARVTILPGVSIGDGAVVGAGAVVTQDLPPKAVAAGNPAHVLRYRGQELGARA